MQRQPALKTHFRLTFRIISGTIRLTISEKPPMMA